MKAGFPWWWAQETGIRTHHPTGILYGLARGNIVAYCRPEASEEVRDIWRRMAWKAIIKRIQEMDAPPDWSPIK